MLKIELVICMAGGVEVSSSLASYKLGDALIHYPSRLLFLLTFSRGAG